MTELIILEELDYFKTLNKQDIVQTIRKEAYKALLSNPDEFRRFMRYFEQKIEVSDKEFLDDFPLQAEFTAFQKGIDDDVPIAFYKPDECFTRRAFEERNYICTIEAHQRTSRLVFTQEEKQEQKRRGPNTFDSRVDFTIDPHLYTEINDLSERYKKYDAVKQYWAHYSWCVPSFTELYGLIQREKWSLASWWWSENRFGKSKAACIHHIAMHFGDYSLWRVMARRNDDKKTTLKRWLKMHGCCVTL